MEDFPLKSCVVLGYTDISAAGSRALLGFAESKCTVRPFSLKCCGEVKPASWCETSVSSQASGLICNYNDKNVSLIILNAVFPTRKKHVVANEVMDMITQRHIKQLIILSAFPNGFNSTFMKFTVSDLDPLSTSSLFSCDPFLNALLQFSMVESFNTVLVAVDGRKANKDSYPNLTDGSLQSIHTLHKYLKEELGLDLNTTKSSSLVRNEYFTAYYVEIAADRKSNKITCIASSMRMILFDFRFATTSK